MNKWTPPAEVKILGNRYQTKKYINKAGIKRTIPIELPKKLVIPFQHNRETIHSKVEQLRNKVITAKENFRAFPVFLENKNGHFEIYDAHHLHPVECSTDEEMVTCFVNWWINPNDDKAKLSQVRKYNSDQSSWKMWDYIKSNSDVEGGDYTYLKSKICQSINYLNANVIASAYLGETRFGDDHKIKSGGLELTPFQIRFGDWFIGKVLDMKNTKWASNLNSYILRYFAALLYETAQDFNNDVNNQQFRNFGDAVFAQILILAKNDDLKKLNQDGCKEEYNELKNGILTNSILKVA